MSHASPQKGPTVLLIMDGLGNGPDNEWNAVTQANAPRLKALIADSQNQGRYLALRTDGKFVGLPDGQMGNSEVGHSTIGAGRVMEQSLSVVHKKLEDGSLFESEGVKTLEKKLKASGGKLHLYGLLSDGGVHSHINHIIAMAKHFDAQGIPVMLHMALDGRDVAPESAMQYITELKDELADCKHTTLATISGRSFGMDREKKKGWDNVKLAYDAITFGKNPEGISPITEDQIGQYLIAEYAHQRSNGISPSDENVRPMVMQGYKGMGEKDGLLIANFRTDRAKKISQALIDPQSIDPAALEASGGVVFEQKFKQDSEKQFARENAVGMTEYSDDHKSLMQSIVVVPEEEKPKNVLAEVISNAGLQQLHLAESQKYPHVTRFLDSRDKPFPNEEVIEIPSPTLTPGDTFAQCPAMSSAEVTAKLKEQILSGRHDFIVVNYAHPDMVGHTGDFEAAKGAVQAMDKALAEILPLIERQKGTAIVIADHGNVEKMRHDDGKTPHTQHTTFPVHMMLVGGKKTLAPPAAGEEVGLADIAPTILELMGLQKPLEMTGKSRISQEISRAAAV